jgi:hypothetical protein
LSKHAEFSKLYNYNFIEINELQYSKNGNLIDFIAIVKYEGKVIVIISQGDLSKKLRILLDKFINHNIPFNIPGKVDFYVLCARSQMRKNSTIEMLYNTIPSEYRKEFTTIKSISERDMRSCKSNVIKEIIEYIKNN